jgi:hypothetical protein
MDYISIGALVLSLANAVVVVLHELHIKRCKSIFCSSDCTKSEPPTPISIFKQPELQPNYKTCSGC